MGVGPATAKAKGLVTAALSRFGSELTVLRETPVEDLARVNSVLAEAIGRMGILAQKLFSDVGSAGGHRGAARAEIELAALKGKDPEEFLYRRLTGRKLPTKERCAV